MQPIDYRNATWEEVAARLDKTRAAVYLALQRHGPATTRDLAKAMGWDILNVRPRVTELFQLGFARLDLESAQASVREGVYRALSWTEARRDFERRKSEASPKQLSLL